MSLERLGRAPTTIHLTESELCTIILQCPVMIDLSSWLQWKNFFQSEHGPLTSFINRKSNELSRLILLETANNELLRLPDSSSLDQFEKELHLKNIRLSVGHLCSLIVCEYSQINELPVMIFKKIMKNWLITLRSSNELDQQSVDPAVYILKFLTYLPILIGRGQIVQALSIELIDEIFDQSHYNIRTRIWELANEYERSKLEIWGHFLSVNEWKNPTKWLNMNQPFPESSTKYSTVSVVHPRQIISNQPGN